MRFSQSSVWENNLQEEEQYKERFVITYREKQKLILIRKFILNYKKYIILKKELIQKKRRAFYALCCRNV